MKYGLFKLPVIAAVGLVLNETIESKSAETAFSYVLHGTETQQVI